MKINGVKVFAATMHADREQLGPRVTAWLEGKQKNDQFKLIDKIVTQSSDRNFHCISITLFYFEPIAIPTGGKKLFR